MLEANIATTGMSFLIILRVFLWFQRVFQKGLVEGSLQPISLSIKVSGNMGFNVWNAASFLFKWKLIPTELFMLSCRQTSQVQDLKKCSIPRLLWLRSSKRKITQNLLVHGRFRFDFL